ncbi:nuclear transport factor 2 family protein [Sphingomonas sediminicola]|uniref:Nuclear transport factor 2 family protein n=1 Tax=Sphingomonas sediminicola TaxID=386874 RepID=A0ABX6TA02_9SPHN|nr:nuclear transport factor 2 family protein [Sphingomonas sediminicola]QNP45548.1 nuclear transport factor 2 family protein [Sphingomonas sediminicola]
MTIDLPIPITRYFAFDAARDLDALATCFTDDATVKDEGQVYEGCEAIIAWKRGAGSKYKYTVEPFAVATEGNRTIVTGHLVGNFPGSPVDLRYGFRFDGDRIADLEIGA